MEKKKRYIRRKNIVWVKTSIENIVSRIKSYLKKEGFAKSSQDYTLFVKRKEEKLILVCLYVDDLIYTR